MSRSKAEAVTPFAKPNRTGQTKHPGRSNDATGLLTKRPQRQDTSTQVIQASVNPLTLRQNSQIIIPPFSEISEASISRVNDAIESALQTFPPAVRTHLKRNNLRFGLTSNQQEAARATIEGVYPFPWDPKKVKHHMSQLVQMLMNNSTSAHDLETFKQIGLGYLAELKMSLESDYFTLLDPKEKRKKITEMAKELFIKSLFNEGQVASYGDSTSFVILFDSEIQKLNDEKLAGILRHEISHAIDDFSRLFPQGKISKRGSFIEAVGVDTKNLPPSKDREEWFRIIYFLKPSETFAESCSAMHGGGGHGTWALDKFQATTNYINDEVIPEIERYYRDI